MRLKIPEIEIDTANPFGNDIFNRQPFAESLTKLVQRSADNLVIVLDAPWGEGKTTFVKMWKAHLESESVKVPCIYFDAFANRPLAKVDQGWESRE